jgi:hypothetical protein
MELGMDIRMTAIKIAGPPESINMAQTAIIRKTREDRQGTNQGQKKKISESSCLEESCRNAKRFKSGQKQWRPCLPRV